MELFLLYLFTRLDAITYLLQLILFFTCIFSFISIIAYSISALHHNEVDKNTIPFWKKALKTNIFSLIFFSFLYVLTPTSNQLGIIIGGTLTINAIRSPQAQELGGLVYDAIKQQLKQATKKEK